MKKLLVYLKDYKKESILGPFFKLLEASFELLVPLVMAAVIDTGIANRDSGYVIRMCLIMVGLGIVGLASSVTAQYFAAKAAVGFATGVRRALFSHIQGLSYTEMDTLGTSTMITRMTSDVNQAQSGVNMTLRLFLRSPFIVFGAMFMAFTINGKAAMVFVVTIPLLSAVVFGIMLATIPLYRKVQAGLDKVLGTTRENLTGVRVLRAFNKEEEERARFSERNESLTKMQIFAGRISALMNPVTYVIINGAVVVLIWTGAIQVDNGIITQGEVVALVNYMSQILVELIKLANLIITITKALACANRISAVLDTGSSMESPRLEEWVRAGKKEEAGSERGTVEFDHASLMYKNAGAESLTDIHFRAERGQTIGIIGGTGSGKSSLVNLIPRFYDVSSGEVLVDGVDVREYPLEVLRSKIGVVPQKAVLFRGSIRDNLRWGKKDATDSEMWEALELSQAKEFVEKKEDGLDVHIAQGGKNLSGGQRQRLTIARALVKKPEILILDDSASALDFATDAKLRGAIRAMKERLTVFIVSQRASSIQYADQIVVLDDGEVAGIGSHSSLLESCPVYQEIYYSQFPKEDRQNG
ncbi:ABC transporter ATP-binding protein/permease [Lacrimispora sp. NSJ-141]|uniref:ABC transporter ATP-binding protein/permease n=1 Tax=Lientehia hominis TaxID=2897778 RepID=A0AAP2RK54_9FIRM|nr:ABC transporter ATP-binding protein [Lientehia hominis]MCD2493694.1 ABC transporter ATP-binding protein/permease [Lientehia hominis]